MTLFQTGVVVLIFIVAMIMMFLAAIPSKKEREAHDNECILKGRITYPPKRLTDPEFDYRSSVHTDLSETFRKAREAREVV